MSALGYVSFNVAVGAVGKWPFTEKTNGTDVLKIHPGLDATLLNIEWATGIILTTSISFIANVI